MCCWSLNWFRLLGCAIVLSPILNFFLIASDALVLPSVSSCNELNKLYLGLMARCDIIHYVCFKWLLLLKVALSSCQIKHSYSCKMYVGVPSVCRRNIEVILVWAITQDCHYKGDNLRLFW